MEQTSRLEHLRDLAMPRKRVGLLKRTTKPPLTKKELEASNRRDNRKDSSLRKAAEVPGAANKHSSNRNG